ncbi:MAG: hypothetical protein PHH44_01360 [bacterium]|nr:hypothetical protein [bacterium]
MNVLSLIISFLGGGIVSAAINWARAERSDKKERRIIFLNEQIRKLYGPIYFLTFQISKLFELNNKFLNVDDNSSTISKTIEIANDFIKQVRENNNKIYEILNNNYAFIDPDDIEIFALFYEHHIRLNIEKDESGRLRTPLSVYNKVGNISFMRPEFIQRIADKFSNKKTELNNLMIK